jgi:ribose transport system substrate-binding protein
MNHHYKTSWKWVSLALAAVILLGALSACSKPTPEPAAPAQPAATTAPAAAAPTQPAEPTKAPVAPTAPAGQYVWDDAANKWTGDAPMPKGTDPSDWKPNPRKAAKPYVIGFTNLSSDIDFSVNVLKGIEKSAKEAGVELFVTDNKFPDSQLPLTNADAMVTRGADLVLNFNVLADLGPAIMEKYAAAGIPSVSIDVVHPTSLFFGADNCLAGKVGAEYLIEYAKQNNWPADKIVTVGGEDPAVGEVPNLRIKCFEDTVKAAFPNATAFRLPGGAETEKSLNNMAGWLTAHPDEKHVMTININDQGAAGFLAAVQAADRESDVAIMGVGADAPAQAELAKPENAWKGSVGYFPEKYGDYLIPLALDILEGKPVPPEVHMQHVVIDRANFAQFYPDKK